VVTGEKNTPTVAHACRKRRQKWVLRRLGVGDRASNPVSVKNLTAIETATIVKLLRPYVPVGTKRTRIRRIIIHFITFNILYYKLKRTSISL
jgi:hypothetical protein